MESYKLYNEIKLWNIVAVMFFQKLWTIFKNCGISSRFVIFDDHFIRKIVDQPPHIPQFMQNARGWEKSFFQGVKPIETLPTSFAAS